MNKSGIAEQIKTSELRIGNWVLWDNKEYFKVNGISPKGCRFLNDHDQFRTDNRIYPIPLTPELLKTSNFNTYEDYDDWRDRKFYKGRLMLTLFKNGRCMICVKARDNVKIADIYFIHQLQNLCFDLIGEELIINLSKM